MMVLAADTTGVHFVGNRPGTGIVVPYANQATMLVLIIVLAVIAWLLWGRKGAR